MIDHFDSGISRKREKENGTIFYRHNVNIELFLIKKSLFFAQTTEFSMLSKVCVHF